RLVRDVLTARLPGTADDLGGRLGAGQADGGGGEVLDRDQGVLPRRGRGEPAGREAVTGGDRHVQVGAGGDVRDPGQQHGRALGQRGEVGADAPVGGGRRLLADVLRH